MLPRSLLLPALALTFAAACGGDDAASPDATTDAATDAGVDASPDAADPVVRITVLGGGNPIPGVDVVWSDAAGAVVTHERTDATGSTSEPLAAGGAVTVAVATPDGNIAVTYAAVEPGDDLRLVLGAAPPDPISDATITWPGPFTGAARYRVSLGCVALDTADPTAPTTTSLPRACLGSDQRVTATAVALDGNDAALAWAIADDVAVTAGTPTAIALGAWQAGAPLAVTLTNPPAGAVAAQLDPHGFIDGLDHGGAVARAGATAGGFALSSSVPAGVLDRLGYVVLVTTGAALHGLAVGRDDVPTAASHDLATALLPGLGPVTPSGVDGRLVMTWTAGTATSADGLVVLTSWTDGPQRGAWYAVAPPTAAGSLTLPALPEALAAFRIAPTATVRGALVAVEGDGIADYAQFRREGLGFRLLGGSPLDLLPGGRGTVRLTLGGELP